MSIARKNLGPRLAAGILKPRPGSTGARSPWTETELERLMKTPEAVREVALLTHEGGNFYEAFRAVMAKLEARP